MNGIKVYLPSLGNWNENQISAMWLSADDNVSGAEGLLLTIRKKGGDELTVLVPPNQFRVFARAAMMCCPPEDQQ